MHETMPWNRVYFLMRGLAPAVPVEESLVGNKAAGLISIARAGLPVPPGFILTTALCRAYYREGGRFPDGYADLLGSSIRQLENTTGLSFGGHRRPLLVAVRSGAPVSMPGMLETVLDVGLTERSLPALIRMTGNPRQAWDSYGRLIESYARTVCGIPAGRFESRRRLRQDRDRAASPSELDVAALRQLAAEFLEIVEEESGAPFPQDPQLQLTGAVEAVIRSWQGPRAREYRRLAGLGDESGTAVLIQAMVSGNAGGVSGSGVGFTRDPASGEKRLYMDFLWNAQGEEVVSGKSARQGSPDLFRANHDLLEQIQRAGDHLEQLFRDAQDFEFTVQEGRFYLLQSRRAKRTPWAALRMAVEMVREGLIDRGTALDRLGSVPLEGIARRRRAGDSGTPLCQGVPASPGVASGRIVFDPAEAVALEKRHIGAILVRQDIAPEDIAGLSAAAGVLTRHGSKTSHAAVVARQLDKVCVVGCRDLVLDQGDRSCTLAGRRFAAGEVLSIDGDTGDVFPGPLELIVQRPTEWLAEVEAWKSSPTPAEALA